MQSFIFVFVYSACISQVQGRRVLEDQQQAKHVVKLLRQGGRESSLQSIAKLLQASSLTASFQAPGMGHNHGVVSSVVHPSTLFSGRRTIKDTFVMSKTSPNPQGEDEFISDELQQNILQMAFLVMRVAGAFFMARHGQENFLTAQMFTKEMFNMDASFGFVPDPQIYYSVFAGLMQAVIPIFLALGIFSRAAAASLYLTLTNDTRGFENPSLYIIIFLMIVVAGPGKFSTMQLLGWNKDKSLFGRLRQ